MDQNEGAASVYGRALRAHWLLVALAVLLAAGACLGALSRRDLTYETSARLLVSPLPQYEDTLLGLGFIRDSGDPGRTIQTAATLLESPEAAALAARRLGSGWSRSRVLGAVRVQPEGESNVLTVTATADDADEAARVANAFARAALDTRRNVLLRQVDARIAQVTARRARIPEDDSTARGIATDDLNELTTIRAQGTDPTVALAQPAPTPSLAAGAPSWLLLALAVLAGFIVGSLAACALVLLNRRLRDEEETLRLYPVPVLARVPPFRRRRRSKAVNPLNMPPAAREAFRTLRAQLEHHGGGRRSVMLTSASAGDGKTTAACGLAAALVDAGYSVILADFDIRKPGVAEVFGLTPTRGVASALAEADLSDVLVPVPQLPGLSVLPSLKGDAPYLEMVMRRVPELLAEARQFADYVVVDTSPLGEVSDALGIAGHVNDIVLVTRPGHTQRKSLEQARDLLERSGARPSGLLVTGQTLGTSNSYYYMARPPVPMGPESGRPDFARHAPHQGE